MKSKSKFVLYASVVSATAVVVALMIIFFNMMNLGQLVLKDTKTGEIYGSFRLEEEGFSVTFVHSVNKSPVTDIYEVRDGEIYMTGTVYYGFGAGVPTELEGDQTLTYGENGEMIISGMDLHIPDLVYVVGTVSDHILAINGEEISLRDLCGKNSSVAFTIR